MIDIVIPSLCSLFTQSESQINGQIIINIYIYIFQKETFILIKIISISFQITSYFASPNIQISYLICSPTQLTNLF